MTVAGVGRVADILYAPNRRRTANLPRHCTATVTVPPAERAAASTKAVSTNLKKFGECSRCSSGVLDHLCTEIGKMTDFSFRIMIFFSHSFIVFYYYALHSALVHAVCLQRIFGLNRDASPFHKRILL